MPVFDLAATPLRELNEALHNPAEGANDATWEIRNPRGSHAVAVGIDADLDVEVFGSVGYYCAGLNTGATVTIERNCGWAVAEGMSDGHVTVGELAIFTKGDLDGVTGSTNALKILPVTESS